MAARVGRYGPYLQVGDTERRASIPDDLAIDELSVNEALRLLEEAALANRELGTHSETGETVYLKSGRYGPYVTDGEVNASLGKGKEPEDLTIDEAVELLTQAAIRKKSGSSRRRKN